MCLRMGCSPGSRPKSVPRCFRQNHAGLLYVRAPVTRARGVRHQVLRRRHARAHVLKALAAYEPMPFFELPQHLRLKMEHVDVDVVDVSSPTSRTEIPDEDTPATVVPLRRRLPFGYGPRKPS